MSDGLSRIQHQQGTAVVGGGTDLFDRLNNTGHIGSVIQNSQPRLHAVEFLSKGRDVNKPSPGIEIDVNQVQIQF